MRLTRELLPGVEIELEVELVPLLPASVQTDVASRLVRILYVSGGQQICRNGFLTGNDGLVLTTLASVEGRSGLQVAAFGGQETFRDVAIAATDDARGLAVLRLNTQRAQPLQNATGVSAGTYAWAVHFDGCADVTAARARLSGWPDPALAAVSLTSSLATTAAGAPLVDRGGRLLGLITGPATVVPSSLAQDVLDRARRPAVVTAQRRRGFPWLWVSAGVAAAGLTAVLVGGGGGGAGSPGPTTGGIVITIPN
jgi:hypothetical protein